MKRLKRSLGFTLLEFVMVTVIISIIAVVISKTMFQGFKTFQTSAEISEADWQAYLAIERMANEIHTIRSAADITTISASNLVFTDMNGSSVQFQLSGSTLARNSQTLASGISALSLGYLDKNGATTATASLVRYITISLTATSGSATTVLSTTSGTRGMQ